MHPLLNGILAAERSRTLRCDAEARRRASRGRVAPALPD
jgi:hypothetical protein